MRALSRARDVIAPNDRGLPAPIPLLPPVTTAVGVSLLFITPRGIGTKQPDVIVHGVGPRVEGDRECLQAPAIVGGLPVLTPQADERKPARLGRWFPVTGPGIVHGIRNGSTGTVLHTAREGRNLWIRTTPLQLTPKRIPNDHSVRANAIDTANLSWETHAVGIFLAVQVSHGQFVEMVVRPLFCDIDDRASNS